jgi:hypothetical protein
MNQRGLAIMEINNNVATTVEQPPHNLASAM